MKKFVVLKKIGSFGTSVVREFDEEKDAHAFADLLKLSEESGCVEFFVAEVLPSK